MCPRVRELRWGREEPPPGCWWGGGTCLIVCMRPASITHTVTLNHSPLCLKGWFVIWGIKH